MARMFGLIGNRPDLGSRVLEVDPSVLRLDVEEPVGWGVGFYQGGEVLLRRRPIDDRPVVDLSEAARNVRTDLMIGHVRRATIGPLRTENTHPFRYRQWLFAQTGSIDGFDQLRERLMDSVPEFLRRSVRGDTDSELFFHLFLSFLHDAGHLGAGATQPESVREALRASISLVDRLSAEVGSSPNRGDILVTDGETLFGVHRNGSAAHRVISGRREVEDILGDDGIQQARIPNVDATHFTLVACGLDDLPSGWTPIEGGSIITCSRTDGPVSEPL